MNARALGRAGEESAALYLTREGYTIVARNVHLSHNEIDIIARDDTHILFVEVKTRSARPGISAPFGRPAAAVDERKRAFLLAAAKEYLALHREEYGALTPNIDVIEVYADPASENYRVLSIRHFRNAVNRMKGNT